jgi:hypothetical protein
LRDAVVGRDRDLVELAGLAGDALGLGQGQEGDAGAAEGVDVAEGGEADQLVVLGLLLAGEGRRRCGRRFRR